MADYKNLKASDGTGNAVLATITNNRAVSGTILEVTSVENWPNEFIVMTGTLDANGYIEAASATEMKAHLTGTDIEIDSFEPGYTDVGNTSGQVAIIKMTTSWADNIVELAQVSHNDDGTLKDNIVTPIKQSNPYKFRAYRNGNYSFATGTNKVSLNAETYDTNNNFDSTTNFRYTAPVDGYYHITGQVRASCSNGNVFGTAIYKNGVQYALGSIIVVGTNFDQSFGVSDLIPLNAGDYVELYFVNGDAGSRTMIGIQTQTWMSGHLVSRT